MKKKRVLVSVCMLLLFGIILANNMSVYAASSKSKVKKAYNKILKKYPESNYAFLAKDVNGDGKKELFIWETDTERTYSRIFKIYTYYKGKARLIGKVDDLGVLHNKGQVYYDSENKWFVTDNMGTIELYDCYAIQKKSAKLKKSYSCGWIDDYNHDKGIGYFIWKGNKKTRIAEKEYNAYLSSLKKLTGRQNSKENRKKYL